MPFASQTAFTVGDTTYRLTVDMVHIAAAHLRPAHSADLHPNRSWYALVGTHLYYVVDLVEKATEVKAVKVKAARLSLADLGFPVFALGWSTLLTKGHPGHTG